MAGPGVSVRHAAENEPGKRHLPISVAHATATQLTVLTAGNLLTPALLHNCTHDRYRGYIFCLAAVVPFCLLPSWERALPLAPPETAMLGVSRGTPPGLWCRRLSLHTSRAW